MRKIALIFCATLAVLAASIPAIAQSDFTVTSPSTDAYNGLIKPLKAGSSIQIQVKMKNNKNVTYTVSINKNSLYL